MSVFQLSTIIGCRKIGLIEFNQTGDVLCQFRRQLVLPKYTSDDSRRDCRLKVSRCIPLPDFTRCVLMKTMHEIVKLECIYFTAIPPIKLNAELAQSLAQVTIVSDPCPFSYEAFD